MSRTIIEIPYELDEEKIKEPVVPYVHKLFTDSLANMAYYKKEVSGEDVYVARYSGSGVVRAGHIKLEVQDDKTIVEMWTRSLVTVGIMQFRLIHFYVGEEKEITGGWSGEKRLLDKFIKAMTKMLENLSQPKNFGK